MKTGPVDTVKVLRGLRGLYEILACEGRDDLTRAVETLGLNLTYAIRDGDACAMAHTCEAIDRFLRDEEPAIIRRLEACLRGQRGKA